MSEIIVIIVTYNGEKWIEACLDSLEKSLQPVKTVIVDNASSDNTKSIIKNRFPAIFLLEEDKNLGFGQANNLAMRYAIQQRADYIFLLNQDAYIFPDTIGTLLFIHERHKEYGIISPLQLDGNGTKLDDQFGKFISNNYPHDFVQKVEAGDPDLPDVFPVRFVNAAAWFISRECLERTGLFHPLFYHYGEDNNYCSRVQYHGLKTGITPLASVRHDRTYKYAGNNLLLRQITIVPLHILLDLRKNIFVVYLLVLWKLIGYCWKGVRQGSSEILKLTAVKMKWVLTNISLIKNARREMQKAYPQINIKNGSL